MSKKRFEDLDFNNVIIDLAGKQYSMKPKDDEIDAPILCKLIITRARQGATLNMILFDCGIKQSDWVPFVRRNKCVKKAISDASFFHKAYGQRLLVDMAMNRIPSNDRLAKIMLGNFFDITEVPDDKDDMTGKGAKEYKVTTTMVKEEIEQKE